MPSGRQQVRFAGKSFGTFDTEAQAVVARAQVDLALAAGRRPRRTARLDPTLHDAAAAYLRRRELDRDGGVIRASTFADLRRCVEAWMLGNRATALDEDGYPFAGEQVSQLDVLPVSDWYSVRSVAARTQARKELDALKAVLKDAGLHGATFATGLLAIRPKPKRPRPGTALRLDEVALLADCFPDRLATLPLFLSTVGLRITEALSLVWSRVDLDRGTVLIPDGLTKEGRPKLIGLLPEELALLARQRMVITNSAFVWPRPLGGPWPTHRAFWGKVWRPAIGLAGDVHDVTTGSRAPFDGLRPHDLRHTAATWMRKANVAHELIAARLGHADEGAMVARVYNHPDADELVAALRAGYGDGIRSHLHARAEGANVVPINAAVGRRATSHDAATATGGMVLGT